MDKYITWFYKVTFIAMIPYERHDASSHRQLDRSFNRLFRLASKETSKHPLSAICEGNPPETCVACSQKKYVQIMKINRNYLSSIPPPRVPSSPPPPQPGCHVTPPFLKFPLKPLAVFHSNFTLLTHVRWHIFGWYNGTFCQDDASTGVVKIWFIPTIKRECPATVNMTQ